MKFWDSSALVPCMVRQPATGICERLLIEDRDLIIWWATPVECASAIQRGLRAKDLAKPAGHAAIERAAGVFHHATVIEPSNTIRDRAQRLLTAHPLAAADALQLAAALAWCGETPGGHHFVTLDTRLAAAARAEGFSVLPD